MGKVINIDRTPYIQDDIDDFEKDGVSTKIFIAQSSDCDYALVFEQSRFLDGKEIDTQEIVIPYENLRQVLPNILSATKEVLRLTEESKE